MIHDPHRHRELANEFWPHYFSMLSTLTERFTNDRPLVIELVKFMKPCRLKQHGLHWSRSERMALTPTVYNAYVTDAQMDYLSIPPGQANYWVVTTDEKGKRLSVTYLKKKK